MRTLLKSVCAATVAFMLMFVLLGEAMSADAALARRLHSEGERVAVQAVRTPA